MIRSHQSSAPPFQLIVLLLSAFVMLVILFYPCLCRDLYPCCRDLYPCCRDLYPCCRDLYPCCRDLYPCCRDLYPCLCRHLPERTYPVGGGRDPPPPGTE